MIGQAFGVFLIIGGIAASLFLLYAIYNELKDDADDNPQTPPVSPDAVPTPTPLPQQRTEIVPRDYDRRIENWDSAWTFTEPDRGTVSFVVRKNNGLIIALSTTPDHAQAGYAIVLDQRGSAHQDPYDHNTSVSFVSRLPNINGALSSFANARDVLLSDHAERRVHVQYEHGRITVHVDGTKVLEYRDPAPTTGVKYIGFGHLGMRSGTGILSRIDVN